MRWFIGLLCGPSQQYQAGYDAGLKHLSGLPLFYLMPRSYRRGYKAGMAAREC